MTSKANIYPIFWVIVFNLIIGVSFFAENVNVGFSHLATDQLNILPVCMKFDDPSLFERDLFANSLDNVKYYTPFFVQPLRAIAYSTGGDYRSALNLLGLILNVLYGLFWFLLFYKLSDRFWLSLLFALLLRAIIWLPGNEVWGIGDIWTVMPRTVYTTFMPVPFILLLSTNKWKLLLSCFLIGFVFNFHPITGLGGLMVFLAIVGYGMVRKHKGHSFSFKDHLLGGSLILLGMAPFVMTYFSKTTSTLSYDPSLYLEAFNLRIDEAFQDPVKFVAQWFKVKYVLILSPIVLYLLYSIKAKEERKRSIFLTLLALALVILPSASVYLEQFVNTSFDANFRMSFQLIRIQKMIILPAFFALFFLSMAILDHFKITDRPTRTTFLLSILLLAVCHHPILNKLPFIGDDSARLMWPEHLSLFKGEDPKSRDSDKMADYIKAHTAPESLIVWSPMVRSATGRSVIMDGKGASMIIEGNPKQLIDWYLDVKEYIAKQTFEERAAFFKSRDVDYFVSTHDFAPHAKKVHTQGKFHLYKVL